MHMLAAEFHTTLDEDSEFMDNVISKVSQLKTLIRRKLNEEGKNLRL